MVEQTVRDPLELARDLITHGVPVVVCQPNPAWTPDSPAGVPELFWPAGWAAMTAAECDLRSYRPGVDVLAMVGGWGVDAVDVDPKAGGSVDNLPSFRHYGVHSTPSGGRHYLVRSTGIAKMTLTTSAGHVGDYIGGTAQGASRALLYLPGSSRPKYPGSAYDVVESVDLDLLLDEDPDDELVAALLGAGGRRTGNAGQPSAKLAEVHAFLADHDRPVDSSCTYGRNAVSRLLAESAQAVPGDPEVGRHAWAVRATVRTVELVRAGCANSADLWAVATRLAEIKPEGDDPLGILAWALNNADGESGCGLHNPQSASAGLAEPVSTAVPAAETSRSARMPSTADLGDLWDERPIFRHLHDFARARMAAPLAVLGVTLARVVAATPPNLVTPPLVGTYGTPNLFLALVGESGDGKGGATAAAADAVTFVRRGSGSEVDVQGIGIGSGEGILHQYRRANSKGEVTVVSDSVLFDISEVETMQALGARQGATLMPVLRQGYMGETLSFPYADPTKALKVPRGAYRMSLMVAVQPGLAGVLLDDAPGGTPQRFLWLPVTDPTIPDEEPPEPPTRSVFVPDARHTVRRVMTVPDEVARTVRNARRARARGQGDALDGHALYTRIKVSAALALLDERTDINTDDWRIAGRLMEVSDQTRERVVQAVQRARSEENVARGKAEGVRAVLAEEVRINATEQTAGRALVRILQEKPGEWMAYSALRRRVKAAFRPGVEAALQNLLEAGQVEVEEATGGGTSGHRYRMLG